MKNVRPPIDSRLLSVLVCPVCKGPLIYDREANELISVQAGLAYPINDGIPIMIPEEARHLDDEEIASFNTNRPAIN